MCLRSAKVFILSQIGLKQAFQKPSPIILIEYLILFLNRLLLQNWCLLWGYVSLIGHDDCWGNLSRWDGRILMFPTGELWCLRQGKGKTGGYRSTEQEGVKHRDTWLLLLVILRIWAQQKLQTERETTSTITQQNDGWMDKLIKY